MLSPVVVALAIAAANIGGAIASPSMSGALSMRHVLDCTDSVKGPIITQAYADAKVLATVASQYITDNGASDSLYIAYFKTNDPATVKGYFDAIANDSSSQLLRCPDPTTCSSGTVAFTRQPSGNIYFCAPFFAEDDQSALCSASSLPATKSGTMVHELGHAVNHRSDISGSCSGGQALAADQAIENTTNFSCFARQVYRNTQC